MRRYEVTEELIADGRPARRRARLVQAGRARRHHGRPAERPAGDDEPAPDPDRLRRARSPPTAIDHEDGDGDDRLGRAEVVEAAAERGVGERARRGAERGGGGERAQRDRGQPGRVVDEVVRDARHDPRVEDGEEAAPGDRGRAARARAARRARSTGVAADARASEKASAAPSVAAHDRDGGPERRAEQQPARARQQRAGEQRDGQHRRDAARTRPAPRRPRRRPSRARAPADRSTCSARAGDEQRGGDAPRRARPAGSAAPLTPGQRPA